MEWQYLWSAFSGLLMSFITYFHYKKHFRKHTFTTNLEQEHRTIDTCMVTLTNTLAQGVNKGKFMHLIAD